MAVVKTRDLTGKQRLFVQRMAIHGNATKAFREAGYASNGDEDRITACKLQQKPNIAEALKIEQERVANSLELERRAVLREILTLGFSNIAQCVDRETGMLLPVHEMPLAIQPAIRKITQVTLVPIKDGAKEVVAELVKTSIELHGKWPALERLGKLVGLVDGSEDEKKQRDVKRMSDDELERIAQGN